MPKAHKSQADLGRFGTSAEFDNLYAGQLVRPVVQPGLRPTFVISTGPIVPWSNFFVWPEPSLAWVNSSGFDWHRQPSPGSIVYVPGNKPVNIISSLPRLEAAPVDLAPVLPSGATSQSWEDAGMDPSTQAVLWRWEGKYQVDVRVEVRALLYEYYQYNGMKAARYKQDLTSSVYPYTQGPALEPPFDFVVLRVSFGLILMQRALIPPGQYRFALDLDVIPPEAAYEFKNGMPIEYAYRNQNLEMLSDRLSTTLEVIADVPEGLVLPAVHSVQPTVGGRGTRMSIQGARLDRTMRVAFNPGISGEYRVVSESSVEAIIPSGAETGPMVVETNLGWVPVDSIEILSAADQPRDVRTW